MKIKCIKYLDDRDREIHPTNYKGSLRLNTIYYVLEVYLYVAENRSVYRIININLKEYESPFIINSLCFEIVSTTTPSNWVITLDTDRILLSPQKWRADNFWVDYFDGDPASEKIYEEELKTILLADGDYMPQKE